MAKVKRKKVVQSLTFDPKLDFALKTIHGIHVKYSKASTLTYNGYVEGILTAYLTQRFGCVPTAEQLEELVAAKKEDSVRSNN